METPTFHPPSSGEVTRLIDAVQDGDEDATHALLAAVYQELRRLAARRLRHEPPGVTLEATALVHEAYLRLVGGKPVDWSGRGHFFAAAAEAMRRILVERARRKARLKHGGAHRRRELEELERVVLPEPVDLLALDEALEKLARDDPRKAELVKLRYFTGLSTVQAAEALGVSRATAERHWAYARAFLFHAMTHDGT
jgi:RNA polymerase sigma factor (TIGR02999 family)